jgi:hypothetical protein
MDNQHTSLLLYEAIWCCKGFMEINRFTMVIPTYFKLVRSSQSIIYNFSNLREPLMSSSLVCNYKTWVTV